MNRNFAAVVLLLVSFFVVVRSGAIEAPNDSQVLSTDAPAADRRVLSTDAPHADRQVLSTDASDTDQQVSSTDAPDADRQFFGTDADQSVEERIRGLRIEMLKFQILSKLNMKNPPINAQPQASGFSREAIRLLLLQDAEEEQSWNHQQSQSDERLIIHAKGNERECLQITGNFCKMFRYDVSASLNTSAMDLWIYKLGEFPKWISVSLSVASSFNEPKLFDRFYFEQHEAGWNKLPLPSILLPASWNDTVSYQVEISGENIAHHGVHRPVLMVSKSYPVVSRSRRDVDCNTNESCCVKPLRVSFAEIGFNWVLYPDHLDANYCTGTCTLHHGEVRTHYERAMTKVIDSNDAMQELLGECWTLCCKPKQLAAARVIYNDTDGMYHDQYIPELVVKSCSCS